MPLSNNLSNSLTLSGLSGGSTISGGGASTVSGMIPDISSMVDQILEALYDIQMTILDAASTMVDAVLSSKGNAGGSTSPKQPSLSSMFGGLGDMFSKGVSGVGSLGSPIGAISSGLNLAGSIGKKAVSAIPAAASSAGMGLSSGATAALGTIGSSLGALGGGIALAAGALTGLTMASLSLTKSFAEFSPHLTAIFARSDARGMMRAQRIGALTAGSTEGLVSAIDRLKNDMAPILSTVINVVNTLGRSIVELLRNILSLLDMVMEEAVGFIAWMKGGEWAENQAQAAFRMALNLERGRGDLGPNMIGGMLQRMQRGELGQRPERKLN